MGALLFGGPLRSVSKRQRAAVRARDGYRCVVPGCRHFRFIHVHHIIEESRGGPSTLENLTSLCTQHHVAVHDGYLAIEGTPSTGLVFRHEGGTLYGGAIPHSG